MDRFRSTEGTPGFTSVWPNVFFLRLNWTFDKVKKSYTSQKGIKLLDALVRTTFQTASDPRDKVYGILGLLNWEESSLVPVDYAKSCAAVYADTTSAIICSQKSLAILFAAYAPRCRLSGLASWVVDFSDYAWVEASRSSIEEDVSPQQNTGHYARTPEFDIVSQTLSLRVHDVQRVILVIRLDDRPLASQVLATRMRSLFQAASPASDGRIAPEQYGALQEALRFDTPYAMRAFVEAIYSHWRNLINSPWRGSADDQYWAKDNCGARIAMVLASMRAGQNRRIVLIATTSGHIDFGPYSPGVDDDLVPMERPETFLVLRKQRQDDAAQLGRVRGEQDDDRYQIVGPAHVHDAVPGKSVPRVASEQRRFIIV